MSASEYVKSLRAVVGTRLLLLPGVAAVIRDERGRLLLQRRSEDGRWSLPAGAIDPGETPADALQREVREEAGLDVEPERVLGVFGGARMRHRYPNGDEAEYTSIIFACRVVGGRLEARDGESADLRWVAPAELSAMGLRYPMTIFDPERREAVF